MSENTIVMDLGQVTALIDEWKSEVSNFGRDIPIMAQDSALISLKDAGLDNGFIQEFDSNIQQLVATLENTISTIRTIAEDAIAVEDSITPEIPDETTGAEEEDGSNNSDNSDNSDTPEVPTLSNNVEQQLEAYKKMSMSDLQNIASQLNKIADTNGKTLEEILNNEAYASQIQSMLLKSSFVSSDLKDMILNGEIDISQKILRDIFNGTSKDIIGLNDNTTSIIREYLTMVADSNGLSLNTLIEGQEYSNILKESLNDFSKIGAYLNGKNDSDIVNGLINIYDGNEVGNLESSTVSIFRMFSNNYSVNNNQSFESISVNDSIISEINNLGKSSIFACNLTGYSEETRLSILKELIC